MFKDRTEDIHLFTFHISFHPSHSVTVSNSSSSTSLRQGRRDISHTWDHLRNFISFGFLFTSLHHLLLLFRSHKIRKKAPTPSIFIVNSIYFNEKTSKKREKVPNTSFSFHLSFTVPRMRDVKHVIESADESLIKLERSKKNLIKKNFVSFMPCAGERRRKLQKIYEGNRILRVE